MIFPSRKIGTRCKPTATQTAGKESPIFTASRTGTATSSAAPKKSQLKLLQVGLPTRVIGSNSIESLG